MVTLIIGVAGEAYVSLESNELASVLGYLEDAINFAEMKSDNTVTISIARDEDYPNLRTIHYGSSENRSYTITFPLTSFITYTMIADEFP